MTSFFFILSLKLVILITSSLPHHHSLSHPHHSSLPPRQSCSLPHHSLSPPRHSLSPPHHCALPLQYQVRTILLVYPVSASAGSSQPAQLPVLPRTSSRLLTFMFYILIRYTFHLIIYSFQLLTCSIILLTYSCIQLPYLLQLLTY